MNPENPTFAALKRLLSSSKAMVVLGVTLAAFVLVYSGKASWEQVKGFLTTIIGVWLGAQGVEDAAKNINVPSDAQQATITQAASEAATKAVRESLKPPPMPKVPGVVAGKVVPYPSDEG